jgi:hypothetical protein
MVKVKGQEESQYYATANSGISAIFHMIYPHMCMTKDAVNLLQRKIEAMAGGFISGPIMTKIHDYRKLLQKGKSAKVKVGFHEVVRKSAMRIQSRIHAAYAITSKFIEPENPEHTNDAIGMMDLLMGKLSEMFRQFGMPDDPPAAINMADGSLDQERAMFMATHSPDSITDYHVDASAHVAEYGRRTAKMGTWKCQAKNCQQGIAEFIQKIMEFARKRSGVGSGVPNDILCTDCYSHLLLGPSIALKDGSSKTPSVRQIELGTTPKVPGGIRPDVLVTKKTNANANQTDMESRTQHRKRLKAEKESAEKEENGGMTKEDMIAMHTFMCKMSDMKPPDTKSQETGSAQKVIEGMKMTTRQVWLR